MNALIEKWYGRLVSRAGHIAVFLSLYMLMAVEYYRFVYRNYHYLMDFNFQTSATTIAVGLAFLGIVMWMLFRHPQQDDSGYAVAMVVALLFCLPSIVMYQLAGVSIWLPLYTTFFLVLLRVPLLRMPAWRMKRVPVGWQRWLLPALCLLALLPFPIVYGLNIDFSLFLMGEETYEVRAAVSAKDTWLTAYLMGPLRMVLLPMLIVYGISNFKRDWWMAATGVAGLLFLFILNPQKSIFFSIAVVSVLYVFKNRTAKAGLILYGLAAACLLSALTNIATGHLMAESLILRRLFFIPVAVCDNYFSFFDGRPMLLSHSVLGHWFAYPYDMEPSRMIGEMMYNRTTTNCNTGIVGDGYMNFGHVGAVFFVALGALVIRFVDGQIHNPRFFGLTVLLVYTFLNSALFTTMLTHGGLILVLAACFLIPQAEARHDQ